MSVNVKWPCFKTQGSRLRSQLGSVHDWQITGTSCSWNSASRSVLLMLFRLSWWQHVLEATRGRQQSEPCSGYVWTNRRDSMLTGLPTPHLTLHRGKWCECCWPECCWCWWKWGGLQYLSDSHQCHPGSPEPDACVSGTSDLRKK